MPIRIEEMLDKGFEGMKKRSTERNKDPRQDNVKALKNKGRTEGRNQEMEMLRHV